MSEDDGRRFCSDCFIGWRPVDGACWQCGGGDPITKEEGEEIMARADLLDRVAAWAHRTRAW